VDETKQPGVKIAQIILERVTFAHRDEYLTSADQPTPDAVVGTINVEVQSGVSADGKNGLVRLRVSTIPENRPFYVFDVAMVGLVAVETAAPNMSLAQYVATSGSALLYPFVRQLVADLTGRGRYGPVWLNPINLTAKPSAEPLPKLRRRPRSAKKARAKAR
jgi:preprotein translocase subunit SecB